jgi:hypothetical protein
LRWRFHTIPRPGEFGAETWDGPELGANCWGGMCLGMGGTFRLGLTNSIEMGMIGRRVAENEADIVDLLDELLEER